MRCLFSGILAIGAAVAFCGCNGQAPPPEPVDQPAAPPESAPYEPYEPSRDEQSPGPGGPDGALQLEESPPRYEQPETDEQSLAPGALDGSLQLEETPRRYEQPGTPGEPAPMPEDSSPPMFESPEGGLSGGVPPVE